MKTKLQWKKGAFSTTYRIYSDEIQIGELHNSSFRQTAEGSIRQAKYLFRTKGFFRQETQVMDAASGKVIGNISYGSMMTKATITLDGQRYSWKYDNAWHTRWSMQDEKGMRLNFTGSSTRGTITGDKANDLLIISGLFVTNYYQQAMIAVFVAVFIPILVSIAGQ